MVRDDRLIGASFNADEGEQFRRHLLDNTAMSLSPTDQKSPKLLCYLWDHFLANPEQITTDFNNYFQNKATAAVPGDVYVVGDSGVYLGQDVILDPAVVLDTRQGPIIIDPAPKDH